MDISNNGLAVYMNHWFDVGESCIFTLPRIGTVSAGQKSHDVVGVVCWMRELPKGGAFRFVAGIQLRFADLEERKQMQEYVAYVKKRYNDMLPSYRTMKYKSPIWGYFHVQKE